MSSASHLVGSAGQSQRRRMVASDLAMTSEMRSSVSASDHVMLSLRLTEAMISSAVMRSPP